MMRRSSTSRSIGNRSDFATTVNGDVDSLTLDEDGSRISSSQPAHGEDEHLNNYVANQLERVRSQASLGAYEDEFEAQLDEK